MKPLAGAIALAAALLIGLGIVTARTAPSRTLTTLEVPTDARPSVSGGERLSRAVRYSERFRLSRRGTVRVSVEGDHGGLLLSLVDAQDEVREVALGAGERSARFGAAPAGEYVLRVVGRPVPPPARPQTLRVHVATGGRPWVLLLVAVGLVVLPPLAFWTRRRRTGGDDGPRNR